MWHSTLSITTEIYGHQLDSRTNNQDGIDNRYTDLRLNNNRQIAEKAIGAQRQHRVSPLPASPPTPTATTP